MSSVDMRNLPKQIHLEQRDDHGPLESLFPSMLLHHADCQEDQSHSR